MKNILKSVSVLALVFVIASCGPSQYGEKMESPFSSSKYKSTSRYFRAVGKGQSNSERVAGKKAEMDAKTDIASQVSVTMKSVADSYLHENSNANANEVYAKLESISREVMSTELADLRKVDSKTYFDKVNYTVFVAYEINKSSMLKFLKKRAEALGSDKDALIKKLEEQLAEAEAE